MVGRAVTDVRGDHDRDKVAGSGRAIGRVVEFALRIHLRRRRVRVRPIEAGEATQLTRCHV